MKMRKETNVSFEQETDLSKNYFPPKEQMFMMSVKQKKDFEENLEAISANAGTDNKKTVTLSLYPNIDKGLELAAASNDVKKYELVNVAVATYLGKIGEIKLETK